MSTAKTDNQRIVAFEAVMRTGSLSAAARDLGLSQPTVRRAIETLEAGLSQSLFTRSVNGLIPTEKARDLWPTAKAVVETSYAFYRAAATEPGTAAGVVRISASRIVSHFVLPGIVADLRQHYPGIKVELVPDDRSSDLLRRDADLAVRHVRPKQAQLVAKKARPIEIGVFSKFDAGEKDVIACLEREPFIWEDRDTMLTEAAGHLGLPTPSNIAAATDDQALQLSLVAAGVGMGIVQAPIARQMALSRVDANWRTELPVWVVAHEDQINGSPMRQVFDFLVAEFERP